MNIQEVSQLPFIEIAIAFLIVVYAIQVLRGKPVLSGVPLAFLTANKGSFDETTDPAIVFMAKMSKRTPDEVQRTMEWLWLFTTGQPLNPQSRAELAESTAQKQLKDILLRDGVDALAVRAGTTQSAPNVAINAKRWNLTPPGAISQNSVAPVTRQFEQIEVPSLPDEDDTAG